jgi:hypothetical protein
MHNVRGLGMCNKQQSLERLLVGSCAPHVVFSPAPYVKRFLDRTTPFVFDPQKALVLSEDLPYNNCIT